MSLPFTNNQVTLMLIGLFLIVAFAVGLYLKRRKNKTLALRNRFGSEYDLAVREHGSTQKAEAKLAGRETRVETLNIRELGAMERERFVSEWQAVQARFVDHPKTAVTEASDLINTMLLARGYPQAGFEQRAADVSVTYPHVMESYRTANSIAVRSGRADASTEELRTAMIRYRAIFDELIQTQKPLAKKSAA
jgi:LPXTG-motif cell wall-anchored protein